MSQPITKDDLKVFGKDLAATIKNDLREEMAENTRTIINHFNQSQGLQNERIDQMEQRFDQQFAEINVKLDAITKMLVMRQEMHNLVRELRGQGLKLDESKIFVA